MNDVEKQLLSEAIDMLPADELVSATLDVVAQRPDCRHAAATIAQSVMLDLRTIFEHAMLDNTTGKMNEDLATILADTMLPIVASWMVVNIDADKLGDKNS